MTDYATLTVPALRAECKRLGLPCYQHLGRRIRKKDLIRQLTSDVPESPLRHPAVPAAPKASPTLEAPHVATCGTDSTTDPMAAMRAQAEHDLMVDWCTATKHASALGISRDELLNQDAQTMHRILQGYARPADEGSDPGDGGCGVSVLGQMTWRCSR